MISPTDLMRSDLLELPVMFSCGALRDIFFLADYADK